MSILRKIPKIEQVLDNMSIESLKRLESLMNSGNGATETYTLFGGENKLNYTNKDLGVWYCNIELERNKSVETGFLIWESETKALFISYDITQCLKEYEIDLTNYTFVLINEKLSIEEFRRVLEDNINKEVVHIDTTGNVEIGKNLVVDGKVILNGKADLVDTSGNELISGGSSFINVEDYIDFETGSGKSIELRNELETRISLNNENYGFVSGLPADLYITNEKINIASIHYQSDENLLQYVVYQLPPKNGGLELSIYGLNIPFINLMEPSETPKLISYVNGKQSDLTIGDGLKIENGALDVNRNGVFKTNTITISKSEISLDETNNKQINFNTTAQEKITNLFTLMNQNQNNIVSIKSVIKLSDGSNFIIYMDYHARSAINNENIQGIAISSAINNSFDLHLVSHVRWQSSTDLTNYFSYIQEYEITFCYF